MNRRMIEYGQYMFFSGNKTHGGITYEAEASGEHKMYPCFHLHVDDKRSKRMGFSLNYDTEDKASAEDYLPKEYHQFNEPVHVMNHAIKYMEQFQDAMESLSKAPIRMRGEEAKQMEKLLEDYAKIRKATDLSVDVISDKLPRKIKKTATRKGGRKTTKQKVGKGK
jgi:hypothetical protein